MPSLTSSFIIESSPPKYSSRSSRVSGSSLAAHNRCPWVMWGFWRSIIAFSCGLSNKKRGLIMKYWSSGFWNAIKTTSESLCFRPDLPACCQIEIMVPGYPDIITASNVPILIPSSSALVVVTPTSSPVLSLCSMPRLSSARYPALYAVIFPAILGLVMAIWPLDHMAISSAIFRETVKHNVCKFCIIKNKKRFMVSWWAERSFFFL